MKRKILSSPVLLVALICAALSWIGCKQSNKTFEKISVDTALIDSVKKTSDSSYTKPYYTGHFATAEYYINNKDSTIMQVMKDSSNQVRQIIIANSKRRLYFAQYFANGQLMASYQFNADGLNDGDSKEYFENGAVNMSGSYNNGLRAGKWKNFDENGNYLFTSIYNNNGQQVATEQ